MIFDFPMTQFLMLICHFQLVDYLGLIYNILTHFPNDLNPKNDAIMICGSPELNKKCRTKFHNEGWHEGNTGDMGDFLLERAFVDK